MRGLFAGVKLGTGGQLMLPVLSLEALSMLQLLSLTGTSNFHALDLGAEGGLKLAESMRALTTLRSLTLSSTTSFVFAS